MNIDLFAGVFALFLALWGIIKGAASEIFGILALVAAYFLSSPATSLALEVFKIRGAEYFVMQTAGRIVFWFVLYFLIIAVGRFIERKFIRSGKLRVANRIFGAVLGATKAFLIIVIFFWSLDSLLALTGIDAPALLKKSRLYSFAVKRNLIKKTKKYKQLEKMKKIKELAERLNNLKSAGALTQAGDAELQDALKGADIGGIMKMLEEMKMNKKDGVLPDNLDINRLRKMLGEMNSKNLKKIRKASK